MSAIGNKLRLVEGGNYMHWCSGCKIAHEIPVGSPFKLNGPVWNYNHNPLFPTFSPSVRVTETKCHYLITGGMIFYFDDSPHKFAGQTMKLPDFPL